MPQPASRSTRFPASTRRSIEKTKERLVGVIAPLLGVPVHVA
jgi:hypothetical protein